MLFQYLCGFKPIFYTTHSDDEPNNAIDNLQVACSVCNLIKQDTLPEDLMNKLTEIVLYQMKKSYDDKLWKRMDSLRRLEQRRKIKCVIGALIKRQ